MAAIGTQSLIKMIQQRGFKLWEVQLLVPSETTGVIKQSQNLGINGTLQVISVVMPNLVTDTSIKLRIYNSGGILIAVKESLPDNGSKTYNAIDFMLTGDKDGGNGIPIFADDYLQIVFATAQTGGSLNFDIRLRGTQ